MLEEEHCDDEESESDSEGGDVFGYGKSEISGNSEKLRDGSEEEEDVVVAEGGGEIVATNGIFRRSNSGSIPAAEF